MHKITVYGTINCFSDSVVQAFAPCIALHQHMSRMLNNMTCKNIVMMQSVGHKAAGFAIKRSVFRIKAGYSSHMATMCKVHDQSKMFWPRSIEAFTKINGYQKIAQPHSTNGHDTDDTLHRDVELHRRYNALRCVWQIKSVTLSRCAVVV